MSKTYVAFDIEKAGCLNLTHPIVSIGYAVGTAEGKLYYKGKFNLKVQWPNIATDGTVINYGDFEPRCWNEFWSKRPAELIAKLTENAKSQLEGMSAFATFLGELEAKHGTLVFLSDNASYDIATLDVNLERYVSRKPLRYSSTGQYRSLLPADDLLETLPVDKQAELVTKWITPFNTHDHDPANDAEVIYRQYVAYLHR